MVTRNALDYAFPGKIDYAAMQKEGIKAVGRYLWSGGKALTTVEANTLWAHGIGIFFLYEGFAANWRGGAKQGKIDGEQAAQYAQELKIPTTYPIYFAVDEDAAGLGKLPVAKAYIEACGTAYASRAYGSDKVLDFIGRPGFQTYAWSGGRISKHAVIYQYANGQKAFNSLVDYDDVLNFNLAGIRMPVKPEDKSALTPAQKKQVENMISEGMRGLFGLDGAGPFTKENHPLWADRLKGK